ncbi:MAG: flagellar biosynthetic protein FliR [Gemmatimonadota bacterium]|nr:flagellar biosynthetic protein FliR [Gemmatimonadota bacterium]
MQLAGSVDLFAPQSAAVLVLFGTRMTGLILIAPVFSSTAVPVTVRTAVLIVLTVLLQPVALAHAAPNAAVTPATMISELLVGFAIGLGAAIFVGAAEAAGDLIAIQIGLSGAALLDPLNNTQAPVLATLTQMMAVSLMLALNGHIAIIESLSASTQAIPVGASLNMPNGIAAIVSLGGSLFAMGLRFAAPVIATVLIANAALAVLSRAAPQLNVLALAFPIQIGLGLFALAASLPYIAAYFINWQTDYDVMLTTVFRALAVPGGR